jgi:hypothetical protein
MNMNKAALRNVGPAHQDEAGESRTASLDPRLRTLMKLVERYDRLNAIEAHTVFRIHGRVICVVTHDGRTLFETAGDFRAAGGLKPSDEASDLGLSGERYRDHVIARIAYYLCECHGTSVESKHYRAGAAPLLGELREQTFGIPRTRLWAIAAGAAMGYDSNEFQQSIQVLPKN